MGAVLVWPALNTFSLFTAAKAAKMLKKNTLNEQVEEKYIATM